MRPSWLAIGVLLLLSTPPAYAQTGEQTRRKGRITGTVINAEGEAISQALICKMITRSQSRSTSCGVARTDEIGRFEIEHVEMGEVGLYAEKQEAGYWNEDGDLIQEVMLTPEASFADVILNVGARPGELSIVVKDKVTTKPVESCTIRTTQGNPHVHKH